MGVDAGDLSAAACATCAARALQICKAAALVLRDYEPIQEVQQSGRKESARRIAVYADELKDDVAFLCSGWASRSAAVPNGRQLLSVLLAGEIVSAQLVVGQSDGWFIDSITDITYRLFRREEIHDVAKRLPEARTTMFDIVAQEIKRADDFIVNLGRGSAEQRIAYLIISILNRLQKLGMTFLDAACVSFPLRQQHIADATGLTVVHVSNILGDFRRRGIIELADRKLRILDWKQLVKLSALHTL